ncbi:MAG: START-like domain-containing protein [Cytophagales bacterium]|nr:START-like domain-containing protein [Bernardetiaceae bacterium]MDW8205817.1 START-like domain-containing protein [Cytophagales bacterium]
MAKFKYVAEFEINASVKMLFPYISTPAGLSEWFAEKVKVLNAEERIYDIVWDGISHPAKLTALQHNKHVKFVFLPENEADKGDPSFLEFKLTHNDMTDTSFLKIIDYSPLDNEDDLKELWNGLIHSLCELIGAKETHA